MKDLPAIASSTATPVSLHRTYKIAVSDEMAGQPRRAILNDLQHLSVCAGHMAVVYTWEQGSVTHTQTQLFDRQLQSTA